MYLSAKGETGTSYMFVVNKKKNKKKEGIPTPNKYVYSLVLTRNLKHKGAVIETTLRRFD